MTVICAKMPIQIPYGVCEIDSKNVLNKINEKLKMYICERRHLYA